MAITAELKRLLLNPMPDITVAKASPEFLPTCDADGAGAGNAASIIGIAGALAIGNTRPGQAPIDQAATLFFCKVTVFADPEQTQSLVRGAKVRARRCSINHRHKTERRKTGTIAIAKAATNFGFNITCPDFCPSYKTCH